MNHNTNISRRTLLGATAALGAIGLPAMAQSKTILRISTPAVPDDWHAKNVDRVQGCAGKIRSW